MKLIPCPNCAKPAQATRAGHLHCLGRMHDQIITLFCRRCGRNFKLTAVQFNALPLMTSREIEAATCDLPMPAAAARAHEEALAEAPGHEPLTLIVPADR